MKKCSGILFLFLLFYNYPKSLFAQNKTVFSLNDYYTAIAKYHPLVRQAQLWDDQAKAELRMARGAFDLKLTTTFDYKALANKAYYNRLNPELKVPLWPGLDLKAGNERNTGNFVNPEDLTNTQGLTYAGVSVPLGQGLFIDTRRATLKQALVFQNLAKAERIKTINKILLSAAKDYWEWYFNFRQLENAKIAFNLAKNRYLAVRDRALIGDLAFIDTTEALIFLQDRENMLNQSKIEFSVSTFNLSNNLWDQNQNPILLDTIAIPEQNPVFLSAKNDSLYAALVAFAKINHPELIKIESKLNMLGYDYRLSKENLKPILNFKYNFLKRSDIAFASPNFFQNNFKMGIDFSFPLFLRKERGKVLSVKTKIQQTQFEKSDLNRSILTELNNTYIELQNLEQQLDIQRRMVDNYKILRDGELKKFENGESTLFLINSRESKLIEAQIKYASLESKYMKHLASLSWAAGQNQINAQ